MSSPILDQFGRRYEARRAPESRTLAVAPIMDSWREYVTSGLTAEKLASILREADGGNVGRQAELFEQIEEKDAHIRAEMGKRKRALADLPFKVQPASDDSRDVRVAEFVQNYLDNLNEFEQIIKCFQDAVGKGYSGVWQDWDVSEGQAMPQKYEFVPQKRFTFLDPATGLFRRTPLLLTDEAPTGEEIPAWSMMMNIYGGMSGNPCRSAIYRVCSWMFLFKNYAIKDWVVFGEVYGMPLRLGKYSPGASENDKQALVAAIASLGSDAAGIISKSTAIEFIESAGGAASGDLWENLAAFANGENSKAILGGTLTSDPGKRGAFALGEIHNDVRWDLAKSDSWAGASAFQQGIRPMVGFNFGWDTKPPLLIPVWEEQEDKDKKATWVTKLEGVPIPLAWVLKEFGIPEAKAGEKVIVFGQTPAAPEDEAGVAKLLRQIIAKSNPGNDPGPGATIETLTENALDGADFGGLLRPVEEALESSTSLEDFKERLHAVYKDVDHEVIGEHMARALAVAELAGRFDV